ncbi:hypothetical protein MMC30_007149 [Trapelia coarctata]|nr:hypothetical protein [Trapelia coarctata]
MLVRAHNERLKEGNLSALRQIKNATEREKKHLQLIQDLGQEIRHNVKSRSEADLASTGRSETSVTALADRMDINGMSDPVGCRAAGPESSPALHRADTVINMSMGSSTGSRTPCEDSGGKQEACSSASSLPRLQQPPDVCDSTTDTLETTSVVQRTTSQSPADMDNTSTDHLPPIKTPARRQSGIPTGRGNKGRNVGTKARDNKRQTRESPSASLNGAVSGDVEKSADVVCSTRFVPQPSPPPSNSKETPRGFFISQSYAKQGFGHVPLQFCPAQGDLSGETFNPYAIRLPSREERALVVSDADVDGLPGLLEEMTKHIPSVNNDDLIKHLRGGMKPNEDLHLSHSGGITGIVNSLSKKETYHRYAKTVIAILKYSLMAV